MKIIDSNTIMRHEVAISVHHCIYFYTLVKYVFLKSTNFFKNTDRLLGLNKMKNANEKYISVIPIPASI